MRIKHAIKSHIGYTLLIRFMKPFAYACLSLCVCARARVEIHVFGGILCEAYQRYESNDKSNHGMAGLIETLNM